MNTTMNITERGMRIISGQEAELRTRVIMECEDTARAACIEPIVLPSVEPRQMYCGAGSSGVEIDRQMYSLQCGGRDLVLRPEATTTIRAWAMNHWQSLSKDTMVYYIQQCFRRERPQRGRYREFTQFGVEILKPSEDWEIWLIQLAETMVRNPQMPEFPMKTNEHVARGMSYYTGGVGFEIECDLLGAQKQIVGGGAYDVGIGFALGVDRLALARMIHLGDSKTPAAIVAGEGEAA